MHGNSFALKHPSQRGQALRHFCRNPHCRSKLQEPTANLHRAFCVHGCHQQFYRLRCIVCEKELPPGRSDRRFCRKPSCRNQYYRNPVLFDFNAPKLGLGTGRAHLASKSSIKPGTFSSDSGDRPWRIVAAGSAISANAYHCASLPIDPDTARRTAAANDWVVSARRLLGRDASIGSAIRRPRPPRPSSSTTRISTKFLTTCRFRGSCAGCRRPIHDRHSAADPSISSTRPPG